MAVITATVTNAGLDLFGKACIGTDVLSNFYIAVGTGTNTPAVTDSQLQTESSTSGARQKATVTAGTNHGEITIAVTLATTDAVSVAVGEVGFFSGNSASSSINSGVLVARGLYSHTKTNSETLTLSLDFTF